THKVYEILDNKTETQAQPEDE
ncbi:MAG: hypothetical protein JWO32_827, partial [Bacteroidetes bacterium]|nr:hypothetical protein [Bacteroidota bacterium]